MVPRVAQLAALTLGIAFLVFGLGTGGALALDRCGYDAGPGICTIMSGSSLLGGTSIVGAALLARRGDPWYEWLTFGLIGLFLGIPLYWLAWMWIAYWLQGTTE